MRRGDADHLLAEPSHTALGGVPAVHVRYDNLKAAVSRTLFGRDRVESARWVASEVTAAVRCAQPTVTPGRLPTP